MPAMATNRIPVEQWTDPRHRDGWQGELLAAEWLQRRGWSLESHRFALGHHDVDLIMRRGPLVAFVEVKVRRSSRCGAGEEAISPRKRRVIEHLAWAWILRHGRASDQYRFDVVALAGPGPGVTSIRHIEDAWRPGWR